MRAQARRGDGAATGRASESSGSPQVRRLVEEGFAPSIRRCGKFEETLWSIPPDLLARQNCRRTSPYVSGNHPMTTAETSTPVVGRTVEKLFGGFSLLMKNIRKGFTLVELIVVLVIIGILAGIAYVAYSTLINKAGQNSVKTTAQSVDHEAIALGAGSTPQSGAGGAIAEGTAPDVVDEATTVSKVHDVLIGDGYGVASSATDTYEYTKSGAPIFVTDDAGVSFTVSGASPTNDDVEVCYTPATSATVSGSFVDGACA